MRVHYADGAIFASIKISVDYGNGAGDYDLIFDFRPTYFSYLQKISANSNSHNGKKQVEPYGSMPVVKGVNERALFN